MAPGSKLVMIGDSITDCGRGRPVGESGNGTLGNGYVNFVDAWLGAAHPEWRIRVVNMGVGGNTVRDLESRWKTDALALKPDWLSVMIGINDVWRHFDSKMDPGLHVPPEEYARTLERLVRAAQPKVRGLVLMTPFFVEPDRAELMRAMADRYGAIVRRIAERHRAIFVDTQAAMDAALREIHPMSLAMDRVHVNQAGHMILARAFLQAVGCEC
jgi:lysophospholipase L1-like esterase